MEAGGLGGVLLMHSGGLSGSRAERSRTGPNQYRMMSNVGSSVDAPFYLPENANAVREGHSETNPQ